MTHTDQCLKYQAELAAAREAWQARWPNYCRACEGQVARNTPATRDTPPDYTTCICVEMGTCPRCGCPLDLVDQDGELLDGDCGGCGWIGKGADDICPPAFDGCGCGEEEEARAVQAMIDAVDLENTHPISELWDSLEDDDPPHPDAPDPYDLTLPPYF